MVYQISYSIFILYKDNNIKTARGFISLKNIYNIPKTNMLPFTTEEFILVEGTPNALDQAIMMYLRYIIYTMMNTKFKRISDLLYSVINRIFIQYNIMNKLQIIDSQTIEIE